MKQTCPSPEQLQAWLNDAVADSKSVAAHVNACHGCQDRLDQLTKASWFQSQSTHLSRPDGTLDELLERLILLAPSESASDPHEESHPFPGAGEIHSPLGRLGSYRILKRIASGAQGILYLAHDEQLHRQVAIKVLRQQLMSIGNNQTRFEREARLAASLNDERIVRVYQIGREADLAPFIVMEYVEGSSLKQQLERQRPRFTDSIQWVRDAALGLAVAHQAGLIHRDIKPSNLMLDAKTGLTKLTDFGLALEQADDQRVTQDGVLAGTPAYMSPEQLLRPDSVDQRTDIYSLGVVLYELLVGEVPFRGTLRMTLLQLAHDVPRSPRHLNDQIPRDLETIVLKAMERDPNARFQSAKEFADELERWQQEIPILSRPVGRMERGWRWCRRRPGLATLAASTLGLLLTLMIVMFVSNLRLSESARIQQQHADAAVQQRDAALETLSQLVFKLQSQFEQDEVDFLELQKNSLQIAIDGLSRMRKLTDGNQLPSRLTAEAFLRMGDILLLTDQTDQTRDCLIRAEAGFRDLQLQSTERVQALKGLVDTLWSRHDLELEAGNDRKALKCLQSATESARTLFELAPSDETRLTLASALFHETQSEFDAAELGQSLKSLETRLAEIQGLIEPQEQIGISKPDKQKMVTLWLKSIALEAQYQLGLGNDLVANQTLSNALSHLDENRTEEDLLDAVSQLELVLQFQLYTLLVDNGKQAQAKIRLQLLEQRLDRLTSLAIKDSMPFKAGLEFLQELSAHFDEDDNDAGMLYFLNRELDFIETRLSQIPGDEFALLERAGCRAEIADSLTLRAAPKTGVRKAFRQAIGEYRELSSRASFEQEHWYSYCNVLLSAAEYEQSINGTDLESLVAEAQQVQKKLASDFPAFSPPSMKQIKKRIDDLTESLEKAPSDQKD